MGLDVTAYSRLKHIGAHATTDWCEDEGHVQAFAYACFPASYRGLADLGTKNTTGTAFIEGGCYEQTDQTETHAFRGGSYGGYNAWRDDLRQQFNPDTEPELPFYELIFFADNEGCIGPEAAADLLADFEKHAEQYVVPEGWGSERYIAWTHACRLAADGGLISFH